jgi:hypothetical protein
MIMLRVEIPEQKDIFDENTQMFLPETKKTVLNLEHSLIAISKWESKWKVPYLDPNIKKSHEMEIDYIKCMTINNNLIDPNIYNVIPMPIYKQILDYIADPMTATQFKSTNNVKKRGSSITGEKIITSELLYYYMIANNIPSEYEKWHVSRLMVLIRICGIKNGPVKKKSKQEIISENDRINEERRKQLHSTG